MALEARNLPAVSQRLNEVVGLLEANRFADLRRKKITNTARHVDVESGHQLWECRVTGDYQLIYSTNDSIILCKVGDHATLYKS